jgi:hypothetical protein
MSDVNLSDWIVLKSMGGGFLGKLPEGTPREAVIDALSQGDCITLEPCFDFMTPMRPIQAPGGGIAYSRDPVVAPFDFTTYPTPVSVKGFVVMFCGDLQGNDKQLYKSFVEKGLDLALNARAQASGLSLSSQMPVGGVRG